MEIFDVLVVVIMRMLISKRLNFRRRVNCARVSHIQVISPGYFRKPDHGSDGYPTVVRRDAEGFITHS